MPDEETQDSQPSDDQLEKIAKEIGDAGTEEDSALNDLRKGISDGFKSLAALLKAHKPKDEEEPEKKDEDKPDKDEDEDEDEDEGMPGYSDMRMAGDELPEGYVDAEELVRRLNDNNVKHRKEITKLHKAVDDLKKEHRAQMTEVKNLIVESVNGLATAVGPMAKAVLHNTELLESIPEPVVGGGFSMRRARTRHGVDDESSGAAKPIAKVKLMKALSTNVISENHLLYYKQYGTFDPDAARSKEFRDKVEAL